MSLPNSTAAGTPFGCMPTIHYVQRNLLVKASGNEVHLEGKEWNPHDFSIGTSTYRTELLEVLDGNISVIFAGKVCNVSDYLTYSVLDKVVFLSLGSPECLSCIVTSIGAQDDLRSNIFFLLTQMSFPK